MTSGSERASAYISSPVSSFSFSRSSSSISKTSSSLSFDLRSIIARVMTPVPAPSSAIALIFPQSAFWSIESTSCGELGATLPIVRGSVTKFFYEKHLVF